METHRKINLMKSWQKIQIQYNVHNLASLTTCDPRFLVELQGPIFSPHEIKEILYAPNGFERSHKFYEIIVKKTFATNVLLEALERTRQTGALKLLSSIIHPKERQPASRSTKTVVDSVSFSKGNEYAAEDEDDDIDEDEDVKVEPSIRITKEQDIRTASSTWSFVSLLNIFLKRKSMFFYVNSVSVPTVSIVLYCILSILFFANGEFQNISLSFKKILKFLASLIYFANPILNIWFNREKALEITEGIQVLESLAFFYHKNYSLIKKHLAAVGIVHTLSIIGYAIICRSALDALTVITYSFATTMTWIPVDYFIIFTVAALNKLFGILLKETELIRSCVDEEKSTDDPNEWVEKCCKDYVTLVKSVQKLNVLLSPILLICTVNHFLFIGFLVNQVVYSSDEGTWYRCCGALICTQALARFLFALYLCSKVNVKAVQIRELLDAFAFVFNNKSKEFLRVKIITSFVGFDVKGFFNVTQKFIYVVMSGLASFVFIGLQKLE